MVKLHRSNLLRRSSHFGYEGQAFPHQATGYSAKENKNEKVRLNTFCAKIKRFVTLNSLGDVTFFM